MNKRGLSNVVITVLLILIAIIAVIIVWQIIKNAIEIDIETGMVTIDLEINSAYILNNTASIVVERNTGEGDLIGIVFKFENEQYSYTETIRLGMNVLESKVFNVDVAGKISNPNKVSIAALVKTTKGKELVGNILDSREIEGISSSECSDSDSGLNYHISGSVADANNIYNDYCGLDNPGVLNEYYCNINNLVDVENYNCSNICSNNACILGKTMKIISMSGQNHTSKYVEEAFPSINISDIRNFFQQTIEILNSNEIDLLVTPEFSFLNFDQSVALDCKENFSDCSITSDNEVSDMVGQIMSLAKEKRVNVLLGTVLMERTFDGVLSKVNTLLVIDNNGKIVLTRMKAEWLGELPDWMANKTLESLVPVTLYTKDGTEFSVLPVICVERGQIKIREIARNYNFDLLAISSHFGSALFIDTPTLSAYGRMIQIQKGIYNTSVHIFKRVGILHEDIDWRDILTERGYLINSEQFRKDTGIFHKNHEALVNISKIGENHVYAEVELLE